MVLASNGETVVFSSQRGFVVHACLKALGRTRLLLDATMSYVGPVTAVRLAGRYVALQIKSGKAPAVFANDTLYDLGSGVATNLASVLLSDPAGRGPDYGLDSLALDSSGFAAWREITRPVPIGIVAISCPSASLCVAGDQAGNILSSTNPTGGGNAWSIAGVTPSTSIRGVSCPSISLCVAVGGSNVLTATDPSGGTGARTPGVVGGYPALTAISCPSASLCVAVGGGPTVVKILTSTDPTRGASSWTTASVPFDRGNLDAVSCPSVSLCVATTDSGAVFTSTDPTGGASAWTETTIDRGGSLTAVSCPSVSLCTAVDTAGNAVTSTDPTGGANTWTKANIDPGNAVWAVSCPSVSLCAAADLAGNVVTSTIPAEGANTWIRAPIDRGTWLNAISCPSVSLCVVGDQNGNILTTTNPAGGANGWASAAADIPGCEPRLAPCISERLYARDDQGTQVVDTAPPGQGNSIGNVALNRDSTTLSWTHDGVQRQLQLR